jgi:MYXO-CTERM domain-containing protein
MSRLGWLPVLGIALAGVLPAWGVDTVSPFAFRIEASNADGSGFVEIPLSDLVYNAGQQRYTWTPVLPVEVWGDDPINPVGVLNSATLTYQFGVFKRIGFAFNVQAGETDTVFSFETGTMGFDTISHVLSAARATAAIGVSDSNANGTARIEEYPFGTGDGIFETFYNVEPGTRFTGLISWADVGSGGGSASQNYPLVGFESLGVPVYNMTTSYAFTLSAQDQGSGTTAFIITPEPTALGLLAAGVLVLVRRR